MKLLALKIGLIGMSCLGLIQCGGADSISAKVDFEILPKSPVVILSDFTLNPGGVNEREIKGPWFSLNYKVTNNNTEKSITIQSLRFTVTSIDSMGSISEKITSIDPADFEDFMDHLPTYLVEVGPGESVTPTYLLYVDGLNKDVPSLAYSVSVEVQGWVGTATLPEDRLYKTAAFVTK